MNMKRMLCAALCGVCLLSGSALAAEFDDVPEGKWYTEAVNEMADRGIMGGVRDGVFDPDGLVSRGTVVTVLWRLAGEPAPVGEVFPDTEGKWYAQAAAWCRDAAIAGGYQDGSFRGDKAVTRQELAIFLCNYSKWKGEELAEGPLEVFTDADQVAKWAREAVSHAVGMGILKGDAQGRVDPNGQATRAALAVMLQRMLTPAAG